MMQPGLQAVVQTMRAELPARRPVPMQVSLAFVEQRVNLWLRFGKPVASRICDRRRRFECYAPGQTFGFVRWASNDYGTVFSRFDVLLAVADVLAVLKTV